MNDVLILLLVLAVLATMALCYVTGFRRGKAVGWCDKYFSDVAKDRARREKNGQFKAKEAHTS